MRTIMFSELESIMNSMIEGGSATQVIEYNIINKKTKYNILKTYNAITRLYGLDPGMPQFKVFQYFFNSSKDKLKPLLTFLLAFGRDYLLSESSDVILNVKIGTEVKSAMFEENLEKYHPSYYSIKTKQSISRNLRSSWNQGGYLQGKVIQVRTPVFPDYNVITFALILAFLEGLRGDFLFASKWVKVLDITESQVRELALEAARRDLLQYNYAGGVTTISFNNLLNKLNINVIDSR